MRVALRPFRLIRVRNRSRSSQVLIPIEIMGDVLLCRSGYGSEIALDL